MYRLTRISAAAPIPLDTFPTVSYPRAEVEETKTKVRPVNVNRLDVGGGSTPTCKQHHTSGERQNQPGASSRHSGVGVRDRNETLWPCVIQVTNRTTFTGGARLSGVD